MMGFQEAPARLFYDFCLDEHVPSDHMLRGIDRHLDLEDLRQSLRPHQRVTPIDFHCVRPRALAEADECPAGATDLVAVQLCRSRSAIKIQSSARSGPRGRRGAQGDHRQRDATDRFRRSARHPRTWHGGRCDDPQERSYKTDPEKIMSIKVSEAWVAGQKMRR
jgi:hypothetical protein